MANTETTEPTQGIARRALTSYGLSHADLELLKFRENAVYKVSVNGQADSVLRVHRPSYHDRQALLSETAWMRALNEAGIRTPTVRPTLQGALVTEISTADSNYFCDLVEWIDGVQLDSIDEQTETNDAELVSAYRLLGDIAAQIHNQAVAWIAPENFQRHSWDLEGLTGPDPVMGPFWELEALTREQLKVLEAARAKVRTELKVLGEDPRYFSLIHADLLAENILVQSQNLHLIDFDDSGYGWHLFEFATPLFFYLGEAIFEDLKAAFLEGYREKRSMPDEHVKHLDTFLLARGLTYLGWLHTRKTTDTAIALTPDIIKMVMMLAESYIGAD